MSVLKTQRISICALKKDRKAILEKLQSMGIMEMNQVAVSDDDFRKMDTLNARQNFERHSQIIEQALEVLDLYAPEKHSMFASLEGKELIDKEHFNKAIDEKKAVADIAGRIVSLNKEIAEDKAGILKIENQIESLTPWLALDVPMKCEGTEETALLLGTMSGETTDEMIYLKIAEGAPEVDAVDVNIINREKDAVYLAVICMKADVRSVENALRAEGFVRPMYMTGKVPVVKKQALEKEIEALQSSITKIEEEIRSYSDKRKELKLVSDYFRMRAKKYEILGTIPQSERTFIISGYVPVRVIPAVQKAIGEKYECIIDTEDPKEDEEPPVILDNNAFSESVEGIVASYGLPKKGEIDPTTIMSFFYVFFFGMMLSDAAYGAIIAIACFVALKKFPRMGAGMRKSLKMFMFCGISTSVWGVLFGGYFGDVIDIVSQNFFGKTVSIEPLWFAPLDDPIKLLLYSLAFGIIHLFIGLGLKGYMLIRDGKFTECLCDVVLWFLLLIGLILMFIPSSIFSSISGAEVIFPEAVNILAKVMAVFGALGILLMAGRRKKNPFLRLALGAYELYNITSWLSDVLSYSRLLALGLATGVIASVVNQMGSMFGKGVIGIIGFIIVFIVGHILNLAINMLGAYVHTNRLQYVEFFGKFYEGGGRPFEPFETNTKYVDIKEETL